MAMTVLMVAVLMVIVTTRACVCHLSRERERESLCNISCYVIVYYSRSLFYYVDTIL